MKLSRRQVLTVVLTTSVVTGAVYAASWSGRWHRQGGDVEVKTFTLDVDRFGLAPAAYWLPAPDRLVLVPAAQVPWDTPGTADGQVLVVELHSGRTGWRRSSEVAGDAERRQARHVFWSLPQHQEVRSGTEILHAGSRGEGPSAILTFAGFGISVPAYNPNIPPFGEPGWRLQRRRFGRWRLTVAGTGSGAAALELTLLVLNSPHEVELTSLAAWLPGGRYLVLTPRTGTPTLLLAGPFAAAPADGGSSIDRGKTS